LLVASNLTIGVPSCWRQQFAQCLDLRECAQNLILELFLEHFGDLRNFPLVRGMLSKSSNEHAHVFKAKLVSSRCTSMGVLQHTKDCHLRRESIHSYTATGQNLKSEDKDCSTMNGWLFSLLRCAPEVDSLSF
jgi:hypothetical protein